MVMGQWWGEFDSTTSQSVEPDEVPSGTDPQRTLEKVAQKVQSCLDETADAPKLLV
jgi:hypothetical protein